MLPLEQAPGRKCRLQLVGSLRLLHWPHIPETVAPHGGMAWAGQANECASLSGGTQWAISSNTQMQALKPCSHTQGAHWMKPCILWGKVGGDLGRAPRTSTPPGSNKEGHGNTRHLCQSQRRCLTPEPVLSSLGMKIRPTWHWGSPDTAEILSGFINCRRLSPPLPRLA